VEPAIAARSVHQRRCGTTCRTRGLAVWIHRRADHHGLNRSLTFDEIHPLALLHLGEGGDILLLHEELELGASTLLPAPIQGYIDAVGFTLLNEPLDVVHAALGNENHLLFAHPLVLPESVARRSSFDVGAAW
jgi:hypothetical protein